MGKLPTGPLRGRDQTFVDNWQGYTRGRSTPQGRSTLPATTALPDRLAAAPHRDTLGLAQVCFMQADTRTPLSRALPAHHTLSQKERMSGFAPDWPDEPVELWRQLASSPRPYAS